MGALGERVVWNKVVASEQAGLRRNSVLPEASPFCERIAPKERAIREAGEARIPERRSPALHDRAPERDASEGVHRDEACDRGENVIVADDEIYQVAEA